MAGYFARLTSLVGGGYSFPFNIGAPYESAWGGWTHLRGDSKEDNTPVSIFRISATNKDDAKLIAARNGVKRLRMLRHPNILQFKDTAEIEERGETVILVVTEPVMPLGEHLSSLNLKEPQRSQYVAMGIYHCAKAVSFLNNDCKLIHGNVCMEAVLVTQQLDWRLHGFDLLSEHEGTGELPLAASSWMVSAQYKAAEVMKGEWELVQQSPVWAVDAWGMGCLMQEGFSGRPLSRTEDLRNTSAIPQAVLQDYQRLLGSQPSRRLNPARIAESSVIKNKLVDSIAFLENLSVKDSQEKDAFFKRLPQLLPDIPVVVAQRKLLPMISQALEFGGAPAMALGTFLKIAATLDDPEYIARVVPSLCKLLGSNDRAIRRSLLENMDTFGTKFNATIVEEKVFPAVATGFSDSNAYLRELTLKSMLVLAPKLSQRTINQVLLKHLAKLQVDEEPPIRANTTILLGNLAEHLSEATQKRVLLNAFTRALKDTFPPARIAGLRAMVATADLHSADEAAKRVIPSVSPLAMDPIADVRTHALVALDRYNKTLKEEHKRLLAAGDAATTPGNGGPSDDSGSWTAGIGSNLGWAISSFPGLAQAKPQASAAPPPSATTSATAPNVSFRSAPPTSAPAAAMSAAKDGWDEEDEDIGEDTAELEARQRLSRPQTRPAASQQARPPPSQAAQPTAPVHVAAPAAGGGWGGDGDDDIFEDMAAPEPRPTAASPARPAARRPPVQRSVDGVAAVTGIAEGSRGGAVRGRGALGARRGTGRPVGSLKLGASKVAKPADVAFDEW